MTDINTSDGSILPGYGGVSGVSGPITTTVPGQGPAIVDIEEPSTLTLEEGQVEPGSPKLNHPDTYAMEQIVAALFMGINFFSPAFIQYAEKHDIDLKKLGFEVTASGNKALPMWQQELISNMLDSWVVSVQDSVAKAKEAMLKQWLDNLEQIDAQKKEEIKKEILNTPDYKKFLIDSGGSQFETYLKTLPPEQKAQALQGLNTYFEFANFMEKVNLTAVSFQNMGLPELHGGDNPSARTVSATMIAAGILVAGVYSMGGPILVDNASTNLVAANPVVDSLNAVGNRIPEAAINASSTDTLLINLMVSGTPSFVTASVFKDSIGKSAPTEMKFAQEYAKVVTSLVSNPALDNYLTVVLTHKADGTKRTETEIKQETAKVKFAMLLNAVAVLYHAKFGRTTDIELIALFKDPGTILKDPKFEGVQNEMYALVTHAKSYLANPQEPERVVGAYQDFYKNYKSISDLARPTNILADVYRPARPDIPISG